MGHKGLKFYITEHIHNNPILYTLTKEHRAYRKEKIDDYVRKNNLLYTFTKDYKKDCEYREFMKKHKHAFALKPDDFDLEESIKILKINNFENNYDFRIKK